MTTTRESTASSSGIIGRLDNSAHVKRVHSDYRLGVCIHTLWITLFSINVNSEVQISNQVVFNLTDKTYCSY